MNVLSSIRMRPQTSGWTAALVAVAALVALAGLLAAPAAVPAAQAQSTGYKEVSAGWYHTCALRLDGNVDCWGLNSSGQATNQVGSYVQISAGGAHTCGLKSDGHAKCWGLNTITECWGEGMCWEIYAGQADAPQDILFTQVSAGYTHSCGLKLDGSVQCWGYNLAGEAAGQVGPFSLVSAGEKHTCALLKSSGGAKCWGDDLKHRAEDSTGPFFQMSAGGSHNCAVWTSSPVTDPPTGQVGCWGANSYGQSSPPSGPFRQVSAGHLHSAGVRSDRTLSSWGYNFYGQVGKTPAGFFKQVEAGMGHSCAITENDAVVCWGRNDHGQANVPAPAGPGVSYAFAGFYPPVKPEPELNEIKAGSAVPLKFSLDGDHGLEVFVPDSPASQPLDCTLLDPSGELAPVQPAGGSGLTYDAVSDQYTYVWKTEKAWAGTCRVLALQLTDDTVHLAGFRFK